jgi:cytochrome c oxidase subunit IV
MSETKSRKRQEKQSALKENIKLILMWALLLVLIFLSYLSFYFIGKLFGLSGIELFIMLVLYLSAIFSTYMAVRSSNRR